MRLNLEAAQAAYRAANAAYHDEWMRGDSPALAAAAARREAANSALCAAYRDQGSRLEHLLGIEFPSPDEEVELRELLAEESAERAAAYQLQVMALDDA